jgi:hypothetical protein
MDALARLLVQGGPASVPAFGDPNGRTLTGHSHDYKRNGTSTLFAAFEVATGKVMATHKNRRRRGRIRADQFCSRHAGGPSTGVDGVRGRPLVRPHDARVAGLARRRDPTARELLDLLVAATLNLKRKWRKCCAFTAKSKSSRKPRAHRRRSPANLL